MFVSSHLLAEMELMCDRIYIIDNGVIIGEKTIDQVQEGSEDDIFSYTFATSDNEKVYEYFQSLDANCNRENGGISVVMRREQMPDLIRALVEMDRGHLCGQPGAPHAGAGLHLDDDRHQDADQITGYQTGERIKAMGFIRADQHTEFKNHIAGEVPADIRHY